MIRGELRAQISHVAAEGTFRSALETETYDVILSDYHLPAFDGMTALEMARAAAPDTPFIFVSGAIGEERAVETLRRGATDYILKDRITRLPSAVERAIAERDERRLRNEAEERFVLAARATRDVIRDWRIDQPTFWVSDALATEWGHRLRPEEATVNWWRAHIHPSEADRVFQHLRAAIESQETYWQMAYRFRRASGQYGQVHDRGLILRDRRGTAVRVIGAMEDVTEQLEAERRLEQEQRISSLGRLSAVITHEFNNVLMGIQPFAEVVKLRSADDPVRASAAEHILSSGRRGRQITGDIPGAVNPADPVVEPVDVATWLRTAMAEVRGILPPVVSLAVEIAPGTVPARFDPHQMHQVIMNLVINAREAMNGSGEIRVEAGRRGGQAEITVADSGGGIPDEVLPRIFDPFFTTRKNGTGLGLSVVKQLVAKNSGTVAVRSRAGEGTVFTISLPLDEDADEVRA